VILWGLIELQLCEAIELFPSLAEAQAALADVLRDEPEWVDLLAVEPVELVGLNWN
jgi:hypothetical protein